MLKLDCASDIDVFRWRSGDYSLSNSASFFVFYSSLLLFLQHAIAISAVTLAHQTGKEITGFRIEVTVHYYLAVR